MPRWDKTDDVNTHLLAEQPEFCDFEPVEIANFHDAVLHDCRDSREDKMRRVSRWRLITSATTVHLRSQHFE